MLNLSDGSVLVLIMNGGWGEEWGRQGQRHERMNDCGGNCKQRSLRLFRISNIGASLMQRMRNKAPDPVPPLLSEGSHRPCFKEQMTNQQMLCFC